jgi:ribosomal protein L17
MTQQEIAKKLDVLIHHWISHNDEHAKEYRKWADRLAAEGLNDIAASIRRAADFVSASNSEFSSAQQKLEELK